MTTVTYNIPNISCGHCVHTIKTEVGELSGVHSVETNMESRKAIIMYEAPATEQQIKKILSEINYPVAE
jgi:copper chaperone CopZ